jgi:transposase-like protein
MTRKLHTIGEKIAACEKAIKAEEDGISLNKFSESLGITSTCLYAWMREYRAGELTGEAEKTKVDETLENFESALLENISDIGSVKVEMVEVLVFSESVENSIRVSVEKPDTSEVEKFSDELEKRVLNKIEWCFAMKGFKFKTT